MMTKMEPLEFDSINTTLSENKRHYDEKLNAILILLQEIIGILQSNRSEIYKDHMQDALENRISTIVSDILSEKLTITNERLSDVLDSVKLMISKKD